ncbi:MAG: two-component system response regulator [Amycolatopsis sp.]|jgi:response regulator of citrate/malate metabolism|uniref:response regulator n=1 Tax=Amycolatopsis sp. TaxID=37632 RepID=UPI00261C987E|nr:response regulator [Amycolatopsis sp.]MCU1686330.1 two-component system response regulator [Amycolatopsis sp.]
MIRVLVVEDEPVAAEAHRTYVERVPGFSVSGVVHSGGDALRFCEREPVDLVLLDFYLPDTHGLAVCRALRTAGVPVDVIAVTSARDLAVVKEAVSVGVVQYLLKPFTFASLREKLDRYAEFRGNTGEVAGQADIDRALGALRTSERPSLPKGMSVQTLTAISDALAASADGVSAGAAATAIGASRVTARRYLEYLADNGLARREPRYGQVGRPEVWYHPTV